MKTFVVSMLLVVVGGWLRVGDAQQLSVANRLSQEGMYASESQVVPPGDLPVTAVAVNNPLGHVQVRGHREKQVIIRIAKRAADQHTLDRLRVEAVLDPGGRVRVRTALAAGHDAAAIAKDSIGIDLVIDAPRDAFVDAYARKGRLIVRDMDNGATLSVDKGDIEVSNCAGPIVTSTIRGKQQLQHVFGTVDIHGLVGDVALDSIYGRMLAAMVHRGSIIGNTIRSQHASIQTTMGDILLRGQVSFGGSYRLRSYRGNIRLVLPKHSPLAVTARSQEQVTLPQSLIPKRVKAGVFAASARVPKAVVLLESQGGKVRLVWAEP